MPKSQRKKWRENFDKHEKNRENPQEPEEPSEKKGKGKELQTEEAKEEGQGACGTSADEKPGGRRKGYWARKKEAKKGMFKGRKEDSGDNKEPIQNQTRPKPVESETSANSQPLQLATRNAQGTTKQAGKGRARGASEERERYHKTSSIGRGKPLAKRNQEQCERRAGSVNLWTPQRTRQSSGGPFHRKSPSLDLKSLKKEDAIKVVRTLNEEMAHLKSLITSEKRQHNSDELVFDLICTLAVACKAPQSEEKNKIIAALKGSSLLRVKIPRLLDCFQVSVATHDHDSFFECLIMFFSTYLTHLPKSYADLPYDLLKRALDRSDLRRKEKLEKELDAFKQARDGIIKDERQRFGKLYPNRAREKPPDNFRDIPICPTIKEITRGERPFLRANIIKGRYENAEHYLDVQFRLLREDFIEPLRKGIDELIQNIPRHQQKQLGMKIYRSVTIFSKAFKERGIIHQVQIDVSGLNTSRWGHSRLINGNFLCLSQDDFKTMLFATVVERDEEKLKMGRIGIQFIGNQDVWEIESRNFNYQMVESPAYFEPYRHVLKGLKELDGTTLPFKKYLVECSEEVDPPKYLRRNDSEQPVSYDLSKALDVSEKWKATAVPVLQPEAWPPVKALPLNTSQLEALKTAITTEFSVIQGPPGTGKTFVGTKIVRCLLENRNAWDPQHNSPMLMVCYTNHALDQFLEKVLEFLPKREIIRVGKRSKSVELEDCKLEHFIVRSNTLNNKHREVRNRMKERKNEIKKWKKNLAKVNLELPLLEFDELEEMMNFAHADQLSYAIFPHYVANDSQSPDNTFRLWLCNNQLMNSYNQSMQGKKEDENEPMVDGSILPETGSDEDFEDVIGVEGSMDVGDNNKNANPETDLNDPAIERVTGSAQYDRSFSQTEGHFQQSISEVNGVLFQGQDQSATKEDEGEKWTVVEGRRRKGNSVFGGKAFDFLEQENEEHRDCPNSPKGKQDITAKISTVQNDLKKVKTMTTAEMMSVDDIWNLKHLNRLRLYLCWVENYGEHCRAEIRTSEQEYKQFCTELEAIKFEEAEQVIRQAAVVGMTTTSAAKYHSVLKNVASKIVVVEEAAEVLEAHILTSLTSNTEHTILIGDHKQLRPKAADYELAHGYNLEVSLFERMVMNNIDCKRLSVQHRMRPEIAALTKRIYNHEIVDHESVKYFEDISGICRNLFFIDHKQPERMVSGLQSYANDHEAQFIVALCKYLLLQGYKKTQITVLTMYIGQLLLLQDQLPRSTFKELKVCAVDDFQGEENDIILLSLVRSNTEGRIGFVAESNRVCVALSRARKGLYCIGNFSLLKNKSDLWKEVCNDLEVQNGIADSLQLLCKKHNNVTIVRKASDFNPLGGCNLLCGDRLLCGHACDKQCHVSSHPWGNCNKQCPGRCPNEHTCPLACHHPRTCPPCRHKMTKVVPKCGHKQQIPCSVKPETFPCQMKCERKMPCGHYCVKECGQTCTLKCEVNCIKHLPCGHKKTLQCFMDPTVYSKCEENCGKVLGCGHPCAKKCRENCQCETEINITLKCEHIKRIKCRKKEDPIQCIEKCKRKLDCGHDCTGLCHEDCTVRKCKIEVLKDLPCGHQQSLPCYQLSQGAFCYAPCSRKLECGHKCPSVCGQLCFEVQCKEMCSRKCGRGHSCQKTCHIGSPCDDCTIEVDMTIPSCGHIIQKPCHIDPSSQKCDQPCERRRACGHPCEEICSRNCDNNPCKVLVASTLPCDHLATLACHENLEEIICNKTVQVKLACGHEASVKCHVAKNGLQSFLCKTQIEKQLPCKHKLVLPCFQNPEECICENEVGVELQCGHMKSLPCGVVTAGLPQENCTIKVKRKLSCGHDATLACHIKPEDHRCNQRVQVKLSCGHNKNVPCRTVDDERQGVKCEAIVARTLPCGHAKTVQCSLDLNKVRCDAPCERFLLCGHRCTNKCGDVCVSQFTCLKKCRKQLKCSHQCPGKCSEDCSQYSCQLMVNKNLNCPGNHSQELACSRDPKTVKCQERCKRNLDCGHPCPGKCSEDCSQYSCQLKVEKNLNCPGNHSQELACSRDPKTVKCQERCKRILDCGHPCPGRCSQPCEKEKCCQRVQKTYDCGHKEQVKCFEFKTATCKAVCRRLQRCNHKCQGICGKPCSTYPCNVIVWKTLPCNHKMKMPCSYSTDNIRCPNLCHTKLPCGHRCPRTCIECQEKGSHELCQRPCNQILVCSHRCKAQCGIPCPPCSRKCRRRCPHTKCLESCSKSCPTCDRPCKWSCPHYQCSNLCEEECDRPRCDEPCTKKLPCSHPCIGLCGENCPAFCATCDAEKISSMVGDGQNTLTETTRYLQLFDCGHIFTVEEMDSWMDKQMDRNVQLLRCPRCSTAITFSYRYGNQVKRRLKLVKNVKDELCKLGIEKATLARDLFDQLRHPPPAIVTKIKILPLPESMALDKVRPLDILTAFTLNNHLIIVNEIEKAQLSLKQVKVQASLNLHPDMKNVLDLITRVLENITPYLLSHQPDLRTLSQVHERTRKCAVFASLLEIHSEAIRRQTLFSRNFEMRLKKATNDFILFLRENDNTLTIDRLERIVALSRNETGLPLLPLAKPADFENFPGTGNEVWKLCKHHEVYFNRSIFRDGEEVNELRKRCAQCIDEVGSD